jgi:3-hydroxyisobutyrate dehydrogenase
VQVAAIAEAIALIEKSGLDRDRALSVLTDGAPGSPLVKLVSQRMIARDYSVHFSLQLLVKDLTYAIAEGSHFDVPIHTAAAALGLFQRACEQGHGTKDIAAVIEPLRS